MDDKYELDELTIRKAENGFIVSCSKKLTQAARAAQEKAGMKSKNAVGTTWLEYYKSEKYVAETTKAALKRVSAELDEYASKGKEKDDAVNHGNYQAGGLGFR